ncbi:hypothetical protein BaRGS_00014135 [Batillaria attramentaria]|uniref:CARD domain-containing protein n=1 Tax=Batillaria attramentaria TaxID=370345 RepID=A0ABD0L5V9_9CAEN
MIKPQRGKVTPQQELCLQLNKEYLMEELDSKEIVQKLRSKFIIDKNDEENILGAGGVVNPRREQNSRLVDTIVMRRPQGFVAFLQTLEDTGHEAAVAKLRETLQESKGSTHVPLATAVDGARLTDQATRITILEKRMKKVNPDCTKSDEVDNQTTDDHGYEGDVDRLNERVDDLDTRLRVIENLEHHAEVSRLQQELDEARKEIDNLMGAKADQSKLIKELQGKNADLAKLLTQKSEQLEKAKEKVEKLEKRINDMETENRCLRNGITRLQTQAQEADSTIKALKKTVAERSEKHEKDMMRMRSDKLRDRKAFDDFKKHVENQFQTLASQSPRDAQTPKSRGQNGTASNGKTQGAKLNFPKLQQKGQSSASRTRTN